MRIEFSLLAISLFIALAANGAWADEAQAGDTGNKTTPPSNIEDWDVDPKKDEDNWYFGMGFEARQSAAGNTVRAMSGGGSSGLGGNKQGGSRRGK